MDLVIDLLLAVYVTVSLLLVLVVLMQRPRSEGLGTAFASGMVEQYIGPATSALVRFTTWMGTTFFILSVVLAVLYSHRASARSAIGERLRSVPALKASAKPVPTPSATPVIPMTPTTAALLEKPSPAFSATPAASATPTPAPPAPPAASVAPSVAEAPAVPPPLAAPTPKAAASPAR